MNAQAFLEDRLDTAHPTSPGIQVSHTEYSLSLDQLQAGVHCWEERQTGSPSPRFQPLPQSLTPRLFGSISLAGPSGKPPGGFLFNFTERPNISHGSPCLGSATRPALLCPKTLR